MATDAYPLGDPVPVLWLCGAPGSGKSVTAWELFQSHRDQQIAYIDIDQLKMLFPDQGDSFQLAAANLATLTWLHRRLGTRALIVSGVITPDQLVIVEAALRDEGVLTWCLVDADDETLRRRVGERGWPDHLADMVVAEAQSLRQSSITPRISSATTTIGQAAQAAGLLLKMGVTVPARTLPEQRKCDDVVVIYGPRAVGKSSISWELFLEWAGRGQPTGYLDADQLGFVHADAKVRDQLILHSVTTIACTFSDAGATRIIINGNLTPALALQLAALGAMLVQLDAPQEVIGDRIAARHRSNDARLTGDDLVSATNQTRAAVLATALKQREDYAAADVAAHHVDVSAPDPAQHVTTIQTLLTAEHRER